MRLLFLLLIKGALCAEAKNMGKIEISKEIFELREIFDPLQQTSFSLVEILKVNPFGKINVVVGKIRFGSKTCILKEVPPYCASIPFLETVLFFRESLRKNGLPIPAYISTHNRKKYAVLNFKNKKQKIYLLEEFIKGKVWNKEPLQISSMALTLARVHRISSDLFLYNKGNLTDFQQKLSLLPKKSVFDVALRITNVALEVLENKNTISTQEIKAVRAFIQQCQERLSSIKKSALNKGYEKTVIPIHGDYNPTNIIFNNKNEVIGIIDFDDCCLDNPIHDLITALLCMFYFTFEKQDNLTLGTEQTDEILRKTHLFSSVYFKNSFIQEKQIAPYLEEATEALAIQSLALYLIKGLYTDYLEVNSLLKHVDKVKKIIKNAVLLYKE